MIQERTTEVTRAFFLEASFRLLFLSLTIERIATAFASYDRGAFLRLSLDLATVIFYSLLAIRLRIRNVRCADDGKASIVISF
jgi:hypothetical protein